MKFKTIDEGLDYAFEHDLKSFKVGDEIYYVEDSEFIEGIPVFEIGGRFTFEDWSNREKWSSGGTIDDVSLQGYREDSPYKNEPYLDIDSNVISMLGVSKPLIAYPNNDEPTIMYPNQEYYFPNSNTVREVPIYQNGSYLKDENNYVTKDGRETNRGLWANVYLKNKYESGGIYINPENKGIFTEKAERNRMGVQQYANYVLSHKDDFSVKTRQQAQFAKNAKNFKHQVGGSIQGILQYHKSQVGEEIKYENIDEGLTGQYNYIDYSDDEKQNETDDQDFWKIVEDENNLMFTIPESLKEELRTRRRDREINLDVPDTFSNNQNRETAAIRNNSPLNMKYSPYLAQYGAQKSKLAKENDGTYEARFNSINEGLNAAKALWQTPAYSNQTVRNGLQRWSANTYDPKIYNELSDIVDKPVKQLTQKDFDRVIKAQVKFEDQRMYKKLYGQN